MRRSWLMEDKEEESETESIDPEQQEILDHLT